MKILSGFFTLAAALALMTSPARADGFSIGGSFDGFAMWSHTDQLGAGLTGGRSQFFFSELPTLGGTPNSVNQANGVTGGDTDFGLFAANLALNAQAEVSDNADIGFRAAFLGTGAGSGSGLDPSSSNPGFAFVLEQAFADFHTEDGGVGVLFGRFQPNTGGSLRAADNGTPFISASRVALLPTFLTGAVAYVNSGEVGAAFYLYNDLDGGNDQADTDLGYGLGGFYSTDEMQAKVTLFLSPEAAVSGVGDTDNELWVFVVNGRLDADMDQIKAFLDATLRRDGHPGDANQSVEAYAVSAGATFMATDMFGIGISGEWIHIADANGTLGVGLNDHFNEDGNIIIFSPTVVVDLGDGAGIQVGYNLDTSNGPAGGPAGDRRNIHSVFAQFTANLDSGAKSRTPAVASVN